jgi:UDP-galactose-lipid carrier transferase
MPRAYASVAKRRSNMQAVAVAGDSTTVARASRQLNTPRIGRPHAVGGGRRRFERLDLSAYGSVSIQARGARPIFKRIFDLLGAGIVITVLSPLILMIVTITYLSGGSPLFRHRRVGHHGVYFDCFKFRTMVTNADEVLRNLLERDSIAREEWLRDHKLKDDPRVTPLGRFLRRTSLDELPQLWNVLRGEMSLVGPRPVVPDELRRYGRKVPIFLSARPGITGLWQVSGRNDTDYRRRVALDVCYVRSRSAILDVYILWRTLRVVFASRGAY